MIWRSSLVLFATLMASTAFAQEPCPDLADRACRLARAEQEFLRGDEALNELRFADARDAFERSHRLFPDRGTAYNLGQAYRGTGQFVEAKAIWSALLDGEFGSLSEEQGTDVRSALDEIQAWPAELCVNAHGPERVRLSFGDEATEAPADIAECRDVNPGRILLRVDAEGFISQERRLTLERSENRALELTLAPIEVADDGRRRRRVLALVVTGVVLAAGGTALGLWLSRPTPPTFEPIGNVQALAAW